MSRHVMAMILVWAGVVVIVLACTGAVIASGTLAKLHFAVPITSLGAPLVGAGLGVQSGFGLTTASVVLIIVVIALSGPVLSAAVGHVAAQREGVLPREEPE